MSALVIRAMARNELGLALDWAADEGWNPGLADAACFHAADPGGFLLARLDDEPIGCVAAVRYPGGFGFLGFYIVRPGHRGCGHGLALWSAAMRRLQPGVVGLDGVVAQQANYRRSGFAAAHRNIRYGAAAPRKPLAPLTVAVDPAASVPYGELLAFDRRFFPASRDPFLRAWITAPGHVARVATAGGALRGYAVLRRCREGAKIVPLFAMDPAAARALFADLLEQAPPGPVFLDLPEPNADAIAMAEEAGMVPAFETARMYAGSQPDLPLGHMYGITSFELG